MPQYRIISFSKGMGHGTVRLSQILDKSTMTLKEKTAFPSYVLQPTEKQRELPFLHRFHDSFFQSAFLYLQGQESTLQNSIETWLLLLAVYLQGKRALS